MVDWGRAGMIFQPAGPLAIGDQIDVAVFGEELFQRPQIETQLAIIAVPSGNVAVAGQFVLMRISGVL